jgi:hypothetical protein
MELDGGTFEGAASLAHPYTMKRLTRNRGNENALRGNMLLALLLESPTPHPDRVNTAIVLKSFALPLQTILDF